MLGTHSIGWPALRKGAVQQIKGDDMPALLHPLAWYLIGLALGGALVWAVQRG